MDTSSNRKQDRFSKVLGIGILVVTVFTLGLVVGRSFQVDSSILNIGVPRRDLDLGLFWKVLSITKREYIDAEEIEDQELEYGAIKGLVGSLDDPATVFLTPEELLFFK